MDLLKPRYKVVASYPSMSVSFLSVGDTLTDLGYTTLNQNGNMVIAIKWDDFPHLFRKLEWWEDRRPEEIPRFIEKAGDALEIDSINWEENRIYIKTGKGKSYRFHLQSLLKGSRPITKESYTINTQNQ